MGMPVGQAIVTMRVGVATSTVSNIDQGDIAAFSTGDIKVSVVNDVVVDIAVKQDMARRTKKKMHRSIPLFR